MKRTMRVLVSMVFVMALCMSLVFAGTEDVSAASAKKMRIPNSNAKADSRVVKAFKALDFEVKYNKQMDYAGTFSVAKHAIVLKKKHKNNTLHEMGHFLSRLHDGADSTKEFKAIYKAEKNKYNGRLKEYIRSTSSEYFAESFRQYTTIPKTLKERRPKTYAYIDRMVKTISDEKVDAMYAAYGWAW